jgi:hypothetical protein
MRIGVLLALWCGLALSAPPVLSLTWTNEGLLVQRHISGCLSLEGGGLEARRLSVPCDSSPVFLPAGGVDHLEAPQLRTEVVLRDPLGLELGREGIPPRRWEQRLVLIVRSP